MVKIHLSNQALPAQNLIFFSFLEDKICCGYTLEVPWRGASNECPPHMFSLRNKKNIHVYHSVVPMIDYNRKSFIRQQLIDDRRQYSGQIIIG